MMTLQSPLILGLAAILLTACAMAGAVNGPSIRDLYGAAPACSLRLTDAGGQVSAEARLQPAAAATGTYALNISGRNGGATIVQSGDFQALNAAPVVLSTASLSGSPADYTASLTVTTGGKVVACPVERR